MKIGIITFWDSQDNYGQIMQGYALCTYLTYQGHDVSIIRYLPYQKQSAVDWLKKINPSYIRAYYKYLKAQKQIQSVVGIHRNFDDFRKQYLKYSEKLYYGFEQLWHEDWSAYDAFVCGSDQIWSPRSDEQLSAFFLQFAPFKCLRIAYAPSFGRSVLPMEYQQKLHNLLQYFDAVSVREKEGIDFCNKAGVDSQLVCDPTILLQDSDYRQLTNISERDNYVYCYLINWDTLFPEDDVRKVVSQYAGVHYFCTNGQEQIFEYEKEQTINNWLASIEKSTLSLTNSYHATVFSILSHTPFVSFPLVGEASAMNNRLSSLLKMVGLENRIYHEGADLQSMVNTPIDWNYVDARLEEFRSLSKNYLSSALCKKERRCEHNICFLTNGSVHHNYGGLDRVTELLAMYFQCHGANVFFVSHVKREVFYEDKQYFLPDSVNYHSKKNASWLNKFMDDHDIDVLINQEGNVNLTLPLKDDVKKITVLHFNPNYIDDNYFENRFKDHSLLRLFFRSPIGTAGLKYLRGKLAKNYTLQIKWADYFIMLSDLFRKTLSDLMPDGYDHHKVLAIHNPLVLDLNIKADEIKKEKIILYVGRIDNAMKRVDKLIRIWSLVADKIPDWKFEICGQGGEYEINKAFIDTHNIPRCEMRGLVNPRDYYQKSAILVMASSSAEGWGMVLIEAQQYGCVPIVLNTYAAVSDIIKDGVNGVIVEPSPDWEEIYAQKLLALVNEEDVRNTMMQSSIDGVKKYDINMIGQQWLKLINS